MAITLANQTKTAVVGAITGRIDAGAGAGNIQVATSSGFTTVVATFTCSDPAFTAGSAGVQNLDVTPALSVVASNSGTATHYRFRDSNNVVVWTGEVKTTAGGEDITLETATINAALDAIDTLIGASGDLELTTAGDTTFATPLASIPLGNPAFAAASGGSMAITGTPSAAATGAGTATLFRILDSSAGEVLRGSVGTSGTDIVFSNNVFGIGSTITISTFVLSLPASTGSAGPLVFAGGVVFTSGEQVEISSGSYTQP
jgi:hypothetical protein